MQMYSYSPSVNIIRDSDRELNYIKTLNGQRAFEQIVNSSNSGYRTFSIVGAYGTGKSTFLWALAYAVQKENRFFDAFDYFLKGYTTYTTLDFVGEYISLQDAFADQLECKAEDVLDSLKRYAQELKNNGKALIIRIDEFGKFLEYAAQHNPEQGFYFIQELSEFVNDDRGNTIMLTTLHQDFSAYAYHLSDAQRKEWQKIKGRLIEIPFNVPSEQLLLIAAERLKDTTKSVDESQLSTLIEVIKLSNAFPTNEYFSLETSRALYPLELLSGSVLTMALQRYGQNDRSLFTFLDSEDHKGLKYFIQNNEGKFYNLEEVHDYLIYHYSQHLFVKQNPDFQIWRLMSDSIEKAEGIFAGTQLVKSVSIIKVIGLLQLFSRKSMSVNEDFLSKYLSIAFGYSDIKDELRRLSQLSIIRYREVSNKFVLVEETDVDIDWEIENAKKYISDISSIGTYLDDHIELPNLLAKRALLEKGTPRYFEFRLSDTPLSLKPKAEIDGYVNLVFSAKSINETQVVSASQQEAILYIVYRKSEDILANIKLIEQIRYARNRFLEDKNAQKEFSIQLDQALELLTNRVLEALYRIDPNEIVIFYQGEDCTKKIKNWRQLNGLLSDIVDTVYTGTPVFRNEMVNKTKLSTPILTARKTLFNVILDNLGKEDFGYTSNLFPPDKTIYHSLIKNNGFYTKNEFDSYDLEAPSSNDFRLVWGKFIEFLEEARVAKISLQEFVDRLLDRPFKLKKGLVDFVLPLFLLVRHSEYSLFNKDGFIPQLNANILDLVVKNPADFSLKSFSATGIHLSVFNKYRDLLNQNRVDKSSNKGFIEMIRPFLSFYMQLPEYAKKTNKLTREVLNLRKAISESTDPEKTFFEDFPAALGYSLKELDESPQKLERFFVELRQSITDIRTSFSNLVQRFEEFILEEVVGGDSIVEFSEWKKAIQDRFKGLKSYLVAPHLKVFLQRLNSNLEDKTTWMSSLSHAILGKQLEDINEEEEVVLFVKFKEWIHELENFTDIENKVESEYIHDAVKIEITSLKEGLNKQVLSIPRSKQKEVEKKKAEFTRYLTNDRELNIFILAKLLKDQMD
ncbi:hypothetical protein [Sphingobacterium faecale]|uniref:ATP-binding protein n=1 Tax=Sphingobacterium faecale TaxID=2803775 RepID=A0ABS1R3V8_9SPHI|nr:hypothetical protein [Sphingobacterium faecale]MBL1408697.1 hypothetical protein [Sphingobacterium faecale]